MIRFFKSWWSAKKASWDVKVAMTDKVRALLEMQEDIEGSWEAVVNRSADEDGRMHAKALSESSDDTVVVSSLNRTDGVGWEIIGSAFKGHLAQDQQIMIAQLRRMFRFNHNAQASVFGLLDYIMGRGVTVTPSSKDPRIWKLWREFWTSDRNKMGYRQFEMIKMLLRDGEIFIRVFNKDESGKPTWKTTIRFMDAIDVRRAAKETDGQLTDKMSQGIIYDPNDAEKPLKYYMRDRINLGKEIEVDASEVIHVKFPISDMDQARGESALQGVMRLFEQYKQWLDNRIILNKLRTAIFAVREIETNTGGNVRSLSQTLPTSSRGDNKKQSIRPGTIANMPPGVKLRMESPNINASDVKDDGRNIILGMAAGTRLPEFMFGDASNANFSSTMMAESPFVKHIHFLQSYLEETLWKPLFKKVVESAVKAEKLKPPPDEDIFVQPGDETEKETTEDQTPGDFSDPSEDSGEKEVEDDLNKKPDTLSDSPISESETELFYGCDIEWAEIIHRDPKEQAEALAIARTSGWVSDKTASERLGFDYAEEVRKQRMIEEDAEANGNSLLGHEQGAVAADQEEKSGMSQMDAEMQSHFDSMSPADQAAIKAEKDPEKVANLVRKNMNDKQKASEAEGQ